MVAEARLIDVCEQGPEALCPHRTGGERAAWIAGWWEGYCGRVGTASRSGERSYNGEGDRRREQLQRAWRDGWECGRAARGAVG